MIRGFLASFLSVIFAFAVGPKSRAPRPISEYQVLPPIQHGALTVFPIVSGSTHDTAGFLTLDEGLRSGAVEVVEAGQLALHRPLPGPRPRPEIWRERPPLPPGGARVNTLVLINGSKRPLILLAGEILYGGKQDRIVGTDRIVAPESDPVDLDVFCVEPGRWNGPTVKFGAAYGLMAQPSVRREAMADKDQAQVWAQVQAARQRVAAAAPAAVPPGVSSYARVMEAPSAAKVIDDVAAPVKQSYESVIRQLREQHAVGAVAAVGGRIIWADIFASTDLLEKYWPKLVRSWAAEAITTRPADQEVDAKDAQAFVDAWQGTREVSETEPGLYRLDQVSGNNFRAFRLTSLLPGTGFEVHLSKMAD